MLGAFTPAVGKKQAVTVPDIVPIGKGVYEQLKEKMKDKKAKVKAVYLFVSRLAANILFVVDEGGKETVWVESLLPKPDQYLYLTPEQSKVAYKTDKPLKLLEFLENADGDVLPLDEFVNNEDFGFKPLEKFAYVTYVPFFYWDVNYFPVAFWEDPVRAFAIERGGIVQRSLSSDSAVLKLPASPEPEEVVVLKQEGEFFATENTKIDFKKLVYSVPRKTGFKLLTTSIAKRLEDALRLSVKKIAEGKKVKEENIFPSVGVPSFYAVDLKSSKVVKFPETPIVPVNKWLEAITSRKKSGFFGDKNAAVVRFLMALWKYGDSNDPFNIDILKPEQIVNSRELTRFYAMLNLLSALDLYSNLFAVIRDGSWEALGEGYSPVMDITNTNASALYGTFRELRLAIAKEVIKSMGYEEESTVEELAQVLVASQRRRLSRTTAANLRRELRKILDKENISQQVDALNGLFGKLMPLFENLGELFKVISSKTLEGEVTEEQISVDGVKRRVDTFVMYEKGEEEKPKVEFVAPFRYKKVIGISDDLKQDLLKEIGNIDKFLSLDYLKELNKKVSEAIKSFTSVFGSNSVVTFVEPELVADKLLDKNVPVGNPLYLLVLGQKFEKEMEKRNTLQRLTTSVLMTPEAGVLFGDDETYYRGGQFLFHLANTHYANRAAKRIGRVVQLLKEITVEAPEAAKIAKAIEEGEEIDEKVVEEAKESEKIVAKQADVSEAEVLEGADLMEYEESFEEELASEINQKAISFYEAQLDKTLASVERLLDFYNAKGNKSNRIPVFLDNFFLLKDAAELVKEVVKEKLGDDATEVSPNEAPEVWDAILAKSEVGNPKLRGFFDFIFAGAFLTIFREIASLEESYTRMLFQSGKTSTVVRQSLAFFFRELFAVASPEVKATIINGILNLPSVLNEIGYKIKKSNIRIEPFSNEWLSVISNYVFRKGGKFWSLRPRVSKFVRDTLRHFKVAGVHKLSTYLMEKGENEKELLLGELVDEREVTVSPEYVARKISNILTNIMFLVAYLKASGSQAQSVRELLSKFSDDKFLNELVEALSMMVFNSYLSKKEKNYLSYGFGAIKDGKLVLSEGVFGRRTKDKQRILKELLRGDYFERLYTTALKELVEGAIPDKIAKLLVSGIENVRGLEDIVKAIIDFYKEVKNLGGEPVAFYVTKDDTGNLYANTIPISETLKRFSAIPYEDNELAEKPQEVTHYKSLRQRLQTERVEKLKALVNEVVTEGAKNVEIVFHTLSYLHKLQKGESVDVVKLLEGKGKHEKGMLKFLQEVILYNLFRAFHNYGLYHYRLNAYFELNSPTAEIKTVELFNRIITQEAVKDSRKLETLSVHELQIPMICYNEILAKEANGVRNLLIDTGKKGKTGIKLRIVPSTAIFEYLLSSAHIEKFHPLATPVVGFPNLLPYVVANIDNILKALRNKNLLRAMPVSEKTRLVDSMYSKAFFSSFGEKVPTGQPTLSVDAKEIWPRGVDTLFTSYEELVRKNLKRLTELSQYVEQSKIFHIARAGVFFNAIVEGFNQLLENTDNSIRQILIDLDKTFRGTRVGKSQSLADYGNELYNLMHSIFGLYSDTQEQKVIFEDVVQMIDSIEDFFKSYKGKDSKIERAIAREVIFPIFLSYVELILALFGIRKLSVKDIKDAISLLWWYQNTILYQAKNLQDALENKFGKLSVFSDTVFEGKGYKLSLPLLMANVKRLADALKELRDETYKAVHSKDQVAVRAYEQKFNAFQVELRGLLNSVGFLSVNDFVKSYCALKVFSNVMAFEEYVIETLEKIHKDTPFFRDFATANKLKEYKRTIVDFLISEIHDRAIKVGYAAALNLPTAKEPTIELPKTVWERIKKASRRIASKVEDIVNNAPIISNIDAGSVRVIENLVNRAEGVVSLKQYASATAFVKSRVERFFEEAEAKNTIDVLLDTLRAIANIALAELSGSNIKANKPSEYCDVAVSLYRKLFAKAQTENVGLLRNNAVMNALVSLQNELLSRLGKNCKALNIQTPAMAVDYIRSEVALFFKEKEAELKQSVTKTLAESYAKAVSDIMIYRLNITEADKKDAIEKLVAFLFMTPYGYVSFLRDSGKSFKQDVNLVETTYDAIKSAVEVLVAGSSPITAKDFLIAFLSAVGELYIASEDSTKKKLLAGDMPLKFERMILAILVNFVPAVRILADYFYNIVAGVFGKEAESLIAEAEREAEAEIKEAQQRAEIAEQKEEELKKFIEEQLFAGYSEPSNITYFGKWEIE